jgi:O-acetylhomoserine (thiol)-lyase
VASGTAGIFYSIINLAQAGDNIVSARNLYGGTYTQFNDILPTLGIQVKFVDSQDPENFAKAIDGRTRALFCESVSNPALEITDLEAVAKIAQAAGLPLIVDATFSTPYLTQPIAHGADIVVHSLTKWFGGHGTGIGGVVVDSARFNWKAGKHPLFDQPDNSYHGLRWGHDLPAPLAPLAYILRMRTVPLRNLGACIAPDNSWMFLQGIETLPLRMERHCQNALIVAQHLKSHKDVEWVRFPASRTIRNTPQPEVPARQRRLDGGVRHQGRQGGGRKFINSLKLLSHLANVGDAKSLAIHPATTTHSQLNESSSAPAASRPNWCGCRWGWSTSTTSWPTSTRRWRRPGNSSMTRRKTKWKSDLGEVKTKFFTFGDRQHPFVFRTGEKLAPVTLAYETYGKLSPAEGQRHPGVPRPERQPARGRPERRGEGRGRPVDG